MESQRVGHDLVAKHKNMCHRTGQQSQTCVIENNLDHKCNKIPRGSEIVVFKSEIKSFGSKSLDFSSCL